MKFKYTFRQMDPSQELIDHVEERFRKVKKYETKPLSVRVTFVARRHQRYAEVHVIGRDMDIKASAHSTNFFESIDKVTSKLIKQLAKKKARIQNHKCYENSASGKLRRLNPQLEMVSEEELEQLKAG